MDKRFRNRKGVSKIVADISDGVEIFPAVVSNISHCGLVVDGIPQDFNHQEEIISLTVSSNGEKYQLRAIPRWVDENNRQKSVGVRIFSAPRNWFQFVDNL